MSRDRIQIETIRTKNNEHRFSGECPYCKSLCYVLVDLSPLGTEYDEMLLHDTCRHFTSGNYCDGFFVFRSDDEFLNRISKVRG